MSATIGSASVTVEIGFESDPDVSVASTVWTDVTSDVRHVSILRGRQRLLERMMPGSCVVVLDDTGGNYTPENTAGSNSPNVLPMKRLRVRATHNAVTYDLFSGYIDSWVPSYRIPHDAVATVTATDGIKVLKSAMLAQSVWEATIRDEATFRSWWRLGETGVAGSAPVLAIDEGVNEFNGTYTGSPLVGITSLPVREPDPAVGFDGVDDFIALPSGAAVTTADWSIEFWCSVPSFTGNKTAIVWSQGASTAGKVEIGVHSSDRSTPGIVFVRMDSASGQLEGVTNVLNQDRTHVVLTKSGTSYTLYVNGSAEDTLTRSLTHDKGTVRIGRPSPHTDFRSAFMFGVVDEVLTYDTELLSATVTNHNAVGRTPFTGQTPAQRIGEILDLVSWPSTDRDLDTGTSTLQATKLGADAFSYLNKVGDTDVGTVFIDGAGSVAFRGREHFLTTTTPNSTFGDSGSELGYTDLVLDFADDRIVNSIRVSRDGGQVAEVEDSSSVTSFLLHRINKFGLLHDSDTESSDHANFLLTLLANPSLQVTQITVDPELDEANLFPQTLGRDLQDLIRVKRRPPTGDTISQDLIIEGIQHSITPDTPKWETTWRLSGERTSTNVAFWRLEISGFSELEETTRLSF